MKPLLILTGFFLSLLCLNSCRESIPTDVVYENEAFLQIRVQGNVSPLRGEVEDPMQKIQNLKLAFFRLEDGKLAFVRSISAQDLSSAVLSIPKGSYKLVALANSVAVFDQLLVPGASISGVTVHPLSSTTLDKLTTRAENDKFKVLSIPMLNDQGPIEVRVDQLAATAEEAKAKPILIHVEPILARVVVYGNPKVEGGRIKQDTEETLPRYVVSGVCRRMYPMRMMNKLDDGLTDEQQGDNSTPARRYAKQPDYIDEITSPAAIDGKISFLSSRQFIDFPRSNPRILPDCDKTSDLPLLAYTRETTMGPKAYARGNTPYVILSYHYLPASLDFSGDDYSWVAFGEEYMTLDQFKNYVTQVQRGQEIPVPGLAAAIRKVVAQKPFSYDNSFDEQGIRYYHRGANYYVVYIRHFPDDVAPKKDSYGRYGVVRNNEYRIRVNKISAPGMAVVPTFNANTTLLDNGVFSSMRVDVNKTTVREQQVIF